MFPGGFSRAVILSLVALSPFWTIGCRTLPRCDGAAVSAKKPIVDPVLLSRHVLEVNSQGFLLDLRSTNSPGVITNREDLIDYLRTNVLAGFQASRKGRLMLFVHGGLNDREEGMDHFWNTYGEVLHGDYYPVFVVWPSGWKSTYLEHLLWVRQGLRAETFREKSFSLLTSPFILLADLGRALTRLPMVVANNSRSDVETTTPIRQREGGAAVQQYQELVKEGYAVAIGDDYSRTSDRFVRDTSYWATLPLKYLMASFVDGLGRGAWDNMLRRTQQVYPARMDFRAVDWVEQFEPTNAVDKPAAPAQTTRSLTKRQEKRKARYAAAGLPVFVELLSDRQKADPALEVTLVGHSMGAIILNRVVRDARMDFANIVYLGAACSIEDFWRSILTYMKEHTHSHFYNLSLHPVAETGEWYAEFGDLPPRGSLLVWIDNFLANPVAEQERTMGAWRNLFRSGSTGEPIIHRFYSHDGIRLKERLHFQAFSVGFGETNQLRPIKFQWNEYPVPKPPQERCDNPLSHSELSEMPYWKSNFWWRPVMISGGKTNQTALP